MITLCCILSYFIIGYILGCLFERFLKEEDRAGMCLMVLLWPLSLPIATIFVVGVLIIQNIEPSKLRKWIRGF